jgi:hypothetical protein
VQESAPLCFYQHNAFLSEVFPIARRQAQANVCLLVRFLPKGFSKGWGIYALPPIACVKDEGGDDVHHKSPILVLCPIRGTTHRTADGIEG